MSRKSIQDHTLVIGIAGTCIWENFGYFETCSNIISRFITLLNNFVMVSFLCIMISSLACPKWFALLRYRLSSFYMSWVLILSISKWLVPFSLSSARRCQLKRHLMLTVLLSPSTDCRMTTEIPWSSPWFISGWKVPSLKAHRSKRAIQNIVCLI